MIRNMTMKSFHDDLDISVLLITPESAPKAVIQLAHGMCGCKERCLPMMKYMASKGVACIAGDHRGHGGSIRKTDDLGYMYDGGYHAMIDDMRMITSWAREQFKGIPLFLLGHSMGSMAARVYAKKDDSTIDGLILCGSPSWRPAAYIAKLMAGLMCMAGFSRSRMSFVQRMSSDRYNRRFASEGFQAWTCSDPEQRRMFRENPLCNFSMTANGTYNLMSLMIETYNNDRWAMKNPWMPVIFISGEDDPMMLSEAKFHDSAMNLCRRGYMNVMSAIYPGMRHEVLNEIGKEDVWDDILDFMNLK